MNTRTLTLVTAVVLVVAAAAVLLVPRLLPRGSAELDLSGQPSIGDGPVKIVLFEDFRCPHCATFTEQIYPRLKREFVDSGKAELFYLNFPVVGPVGASEAVARIGECVYQQDEAAFWELKPALFRSQGELDNSSRVLELASSYAPGIDTAALETCFRDGASLEAVRRDVDMARALGLTGTPSVVVDGTNVGSNFNAIERAVENALAGE